MVGLAKARPNKHSCISDKAQKPGTSKACACAAKGFSVLLHACLNCCKCAVSCIVCVECLVSVHGFIDY